jgi:hypothetical protein
VAFFLVERYVPSAPDGELQAAISRMDEPRAPARHVWTVLVKSEDMCLSLFEAPDLDAVVQANAGFGFPLDRVVEVTPLLGNGRP